MIGKQLVSVVTQCHGWQFNPQASSYKAEFMRSYGVNGHQNTKSNRNMGATFRLVPFSTSRSTLTPQMADMAKLFNDMYWKVVGGISIDATSDP